MPRLESLAVGGYFPTPPEVVSRIAAMIRPAAHGGRVAVRLLDPCAGTGAALQQLAATIGGETYGIELEADRYEEATAVLDPRSPGTRWRHGSRRAGSPASSSIRRMTSTWTRAGWSTRS